VRQAKANLVTGNLLVLFDAERTTVRDLVTLIVRYREGVPRSGNGHSDDGRIHLAPALDHPAWHALTHDIASTRLKTSPQMGLSSVDAQARLAEVGPNRLPVPEPKPALAILRDQVATMPVALLLAAAAVSVVSGGLLDACIILGVVGINAAVGYFTESKVERIISSLHDLTIPMAFVLRDGKETVVPTATLVPGDVVILKAGYDVPADGRVLIAKGLAVNESALTGESSPVTKTPDVIHGADSAIADRTNMVYAGTVVSEGSGLVVITETGRKTELGRVRALVAEVAAPPTPLERQLDTLGSQLVTVSLGLCGAAFGLGLLRGVPLLEMFRTAISLAVAAVPEGLPAVATTTLALGMRRMFERQMIVRRLSAVESLGAITAISVDKTGTITQNRMTVGAWYAGGRDFVPPIESAVSGTDPAAPGAGLDPALERALGIAALCNEAELEWREGRVRPSVGSATESALLLAALEAGMDYRALRTQFPVVGMRARGDGDNWMATTHETGGGRSVTMVKGAPEEVLRRSTRWLKGVTSEPLTAKIGRDILSANARMADRGMRVLGLAFGELEPGAAARYTGLTWIGLVGLVDPIREGVREAIAACRRAGIRIVIITGDQSRTAVAIGRELDLVRDGQVRVLEAAQLVNISPDVLKGLAHEIDVFARVSPTHKYQIVQALQASGDVVAMTGDGVNDAPALKGADIGVAMGARGTELARDLADVVLLDDNFGSIVGAVEQGRTIYANIRKSLRFLLATNFSEIIVTVSAIALGVARPMTALQFLWINLLTDVFPALALSFEPAESQVMEQPPRNPADPILSRQALTGIARDAGLISAVTLGAYGLAVRRYGVGPAASSVAFSTLTSAQLCYAISCRSDRRSGFSGLGSNPLLMAALGGTLALQVAAMGLPPLRRVLGTVPLGVADWGIVAAGAALPLLVKEGQKTITRPDDRHA
jgi:Ca2+-transporting ATPase